jgi:serine acetyltransferase
VSTRPAIKLTTPELGFWQLVWSDYEAGMYRAGRSASKLRAALLWLPRLLLNPSLQLAFLVRVGQKGPGLLLHPVRWLQVVLYSSEIWWFRGESAIVIGPGIVFPHPINVLIGPGTVIGTGVTIYNNIQLGADRHFEEKLADDAVAERAAWLGDFSILYAYAIVQGPFAIGERAVVGLRVQLDDHVPPGALKTQRTLRLEGEWPGEQGSRWPGPGSR